jgi:hypothetical protein
MKKNFVRLSVCVGIWLFSAGSVLAALVQEGFAPGISFAANGSPLNVTLTDVDGDGLQDVGVANFTPGVSLLRNISNPSNVQLSAPVFFATAIGAIDVKFGDLDGDGKPDMVAAVGGGVSVFRNISVPGAIAFSPRVDFIFGSASLPNGVVIQDFNQDGKLDLAFLHHDNSTVRVLKNVSSPGILTQSSFEVAAQFFASSPIDIAGGDFNGDGLIDFFVAGSSSRFFINTSAGGALTFTGVTSVPSLRFVQDAHVDDVLTGDLDGDGLVDLLGRTSTNLFGSSTNATIIRNATTNATIRLRTQQLPGAWTAIGLGELNGDTKLDVITANRFGKQIAIHTNNAIAGVLNNDSFGLQTSIATSNNPFSLAIGDINGDGRNDIVTCSSDGANGVTVYRNLLNHSPVAEAGPDQVVECSGDVVQVTLDGTASDDVDGDLLTYKWFSGTNQIGTGSVLPIELGFGSYFFRLQVSDSKGASEEDTVQVVVQDATPPEFQSLTADPSVLWPPNHKLVPVTIHADVLDECDANPEARIIAIRSSEADTITVPDWEITGLLSLKLRAERLGNNDGRTYFVDVEATDAIGNKATNTISVIVPRALGPKGSP